MEVTKKKVNVYPTTPIFGMGMNISRNVMGIELSVGDIQRIICAKAQVEEILKDGSTVRLSLSNYNTNNEPKVKEEEKQPIQPQVQPPVKQEQPKEQVIENPQPPKEEQQPKDTNKNNKSK